MRRSIFLNARDIKELVFCCLLGSAASVTLVLSGLLVRQALGHRSPDWDLVVGLCLCFGILLGLLLFLRKELWWPINDLLKALPLLARHRVRLDLDSGIAPLLLLSHRINLLLEKLNRSAEARQRRLDGIAHDIRGPLTRLQLRVGALQQGRAFNAETLAGLQADLTALLALDRELDGIAVKPPEPPPQQQVHLDAFCHKIAKSYGSDRIQITLPAVILRVERHLLQRSLNNLIDNALEYGGPPVVLSFQDCSDHIAINVDDHGHDPVERLGTPSPSSLPMPKIQRGLGLAIAESFCRQHGGRLTLGRSPLGGLQASLQLAKQTLVKPELARHGR